MPGLRRAKSWLVKPWLVKSWLVQSHHCRVLVVRTGKSHMRSALALMLGVVLLASAIAGGWYVVGAVRGDVAIPQFVAARQPQPAANPPAKLAAKDDVEVTGAIGSKQIGRASCRERV